MKIISLSALLIGLAAAPWMGLSALSDATAAPLSASMYAAPDRTAAIEQVQQRRDVRRWDRHRHGPRYRSRTPTYRYHYDGWWYASPWWGSGPSITFGFGTPGYYGGYYGGYHSAHIDWCLNRYRSYDPRTDTFLGYDGFRHRCRSPYRG
jgi:hypothetical protein